MAKTRLKSRILVKLKETCVISFKRSWITLSIFNWVLNVNLSRYTLSKSIVGQNYTLGEGVLKGLVGSILVDKSCSKIYLQRGLVLPTTKRSRTKRGGKRNSYILMTHWTPTLRMCLNSGVAHSCKHIHNFENIY